MALYTITEERIIPIPSPHEFLDRAYSIAYQKRKACRELQNLRAEVERLLVRINALQGVQP